MDNTNGSSTHTMVDIERWMRGTTMLGRVIVVIAAVATVTTLVLVERVGQTYEDGLSVTEQSAVLVADAIAPVDVLAQDLGALSATFADGLEGARELLATSQDVIEQVGVASATNLADSAQAVADVADRLAKKFELIERLIPGNTQSIAEEFRAFADGVEPLAGQLRTLGAELQTAADQLNDTDAALAELAARVDAIATDIEALQPNFEALGATATELQQAATAASDRLGLDLWLLRILVIIGGVACAVIGIVTERLARALAAREVVGDVAS
jgi:methyl-accepting chemotaxis protein